jgi:hypothetical protein
LLRDSQLALDIAFQGEPFCQVATKVGLEDAAYKGEPFYSETSAVSAAFYYYFILSGD